MIYSSSEYAEALYLSVREKGDKEAAGTLRDFVSSMRKRGLMALLPDIMKALPEAIKRVEGIEDVVIETAHELDGKLEKEAVKAIGRDADEVEITTRVNPELIGGIRVRGKDTLYDATIRNKLGRMRDAFIKS